MNMSDNKEYIEREAILRHKRKMSGADFGGEFWDEAVLCEDIYKIPAADVEVVRHGEWLPYPSDAYMKCSVCGMEYHKSRMPDVVGYCPNPNCGAKMYGKGGK